MTTGRRSTDWLSGPSAPKANGDERSGCDRRGIDRRAPRRRLEPAFAATLVNHIAPAEIEFARGYEQPAPPPRIGLVVNFRA